MKSNQTPAAFLAAQFLAAYEEAEKTGQTIDEVARLDILAAVARQVVADVAREADAAARVPAWRTPVDAHTAIEFARMAQQEISAGGSRACDVVEVCDYVTEAVRAFEAAHLATEWGADVEWMEETDTHWRAYTSANRPPWHDEDAAREREAEEMRAALRAAGYHVTGLDGCVEIRNRDTGAAIVAMECHGDGLCSVENHDAGRYEAEVPIATMLTYARLMVRA